MYFSLGKKNRHRPLAGTSRLRVRHPRLPRLLLPRLRPPRPVRRGDPGGGHRRGGHGGRGARRGVPGGVRPLRGLPVLQLRAERGALLAEEDLQGGGAGGIRLRGELLLRYGISN